MSKAGEILHTETYKGCAITLKRGNPIMRTNPLMIPIRLETIIVESFIEGKGVYQCFVVHSRWIGSFITKRAIRDTVESWREEIDEIIGDNK